MADSTRRPGPPHLYVHGMSVQWDDGASHYFFVVGRYTSHWAAVAAFVRLEQPDFRSIAGDAESDLAEERVMRHKIDLLEQKRRDAIAKGLIDA